MLRRWRHFVWPCSPRHHTSGREFPIVAVSLLAIGLGGFIPLRAQAPAPIGIPMSTSERVQYPGWWPTKGTPSREEYVGPATCAQCHSAKVRFQKTTPMANASMPAADSDDLRSHPELNFQLGPYHYRISTSAEKTVYSVSEGTHSISVPLVWAFGVGEVGQTYVYERDGALYESRLSFYRSVNGLDFSPGHLHLTPSTLEDTVGRPINQGEARLCFGCHTTASTTSGQFDPSRMFPGVTCEACHGPGSKHVAAMKAGQAEQGLKSILNPLQLNPVDSVDFCGACHRTVWDVNLAGSTGVVNTRFQPYRLEKSRCWGKGDRRLTCMSCHDPHVPLVHDMAAYDQRCLSCHILKGQKPAANHPGRACPVGAKNCAGCHMPRYEVPDMHAEFTDHRIHVVRKGERYSD